MLRQEVEQRGVIPFSRFMEVALYCPKLGYYERGAGQVGRHGDFHTNVSVGGVFGELLAWQFAEWLEALGPGPLHLVEAGAHDGQLAHDILNWLAVHRPALLGRVVYWLIEPSVDRQNYQRLKLKDFSHFTAWSSGWKEIPQCRLRGVIFSNELLDAFPVHRLAWNKMVRRWEEWGVGIEKDHFVWRPMADAADWTMRLVEAGFELPIELLEVLSDGFVLELSPPAAEWWSAAARSLEAGKLMTIDYGFTSLEFLDPGRAAGTLRSYHRHHLQPDVLANPGGQDITAHVNFTALERAGQRAGLRTEEWVDQPRFLMRIASGAIHAGMTGLRGGAGEGARGRQLQTLTHPEHLGRAFRVLVQGRA
ncbi:MAG: hypothetical protein QOF48_2443 [Verrucomicrobiota bacterium]